MRHTTTPLDYIAKHYKDKNSNVISLLDALGPRTARTLIEPEIKNAVDCILEDGLRPSALKKLASKLSLSDYRALRTNLVTNYWNVLRLRELSMQNVLDMQMTAIREVRSLSTQTRSKFKRPADGQIYGISCQCTSSLEYILTFVGITGCTKKMV
ncbi:hypothetical protein BJV82DRAFT_703171 [Fennellomyces sp. T-0311]|nr:hypothetical protein BJV82DRAFT_703171 [Fennellomyces sp. T-0311]